MAILLLRQDWDMLRPETILIIFTLASLLLPSELARAETRALGRARASRQASEASRLTLLPGGIVYPEYNSQGLGNAGTLAGSEERVARILIAPGAFGATTEALGLDYTTTGAHWGFDFGYNGSRSNYGGYQSPFSHVVHTAAGFRTGSFGFGLAYTYPIQSAYASQNLELGLAYNFEKSRLAMVVEHLENIPQATIGFGSQENEYSIEVDLQLPSLGEGFTNGGSAYTLSIAAGLYVGDLGIGYITSHSFIIPGGASGQPPFVESPFTLEHTFTLLYKFSKTGSFSFRFDSVDSLTFGFTFRL